MKSLILVVDHDAESCKLTREYLEAAGYTVEVAPGVESDFNYGTSQSPSLVIVGMSILIQGDGFPGQNAPEALHNRTSCLALLEDDIPQYRMIARDYGADDCIVKPFSARELLERVQNMLRRSVTNPDRPDIVIDSWAMKLVVRGSEVPATTLEFKLLEYLARHPGQVFTRDFLLDAVWGDMRFVNPRSVDACIRRIREKIEPNSAKPTMLKTVRGVGYRMDANAVWQSAPTEICDCSACRSRISALRFHEAVPKRRRASAE